MPHFIAECTENIREQADLPGLFSKVNEALAASGISPSAVSAVAPTGWIPGRWLTVSMIMRLCI
ncbi:5-carboxymethyl-2-hydroxymuconate delta-isomerase [Salmonella enterica subsp. enterica serovar Enteritidis str. 22558]|nr:5-carboxymethyl-2-hydroxymuconate delta-isomerase [Salmonella enterica subsp. enterica serovar Enteritidis str. 22558]